MLIKEVSKVSSCCKRHTQVFSDEMEEKEEEGENVVGQNDAGGMSDLSCHIILPYIHPSSHQERERKKQNEREEKVR